MGMKREAVQEERQRTKERDQSEVESTSSLHADMPIERILEAEKRVECKMEHQGNYEVNKRAAAEPSRGCARARARGPYYLYRRTWETTECDSLDTQQK